MINYSTLPPYCYSYLPQRRSIVLSTENLKALTWFASIVMFAGKIQRRKLLQSSRNVKDCRVPTYTDVFLSKFIQMLNLGIFIVQNIFCCFITCSLLYPVKTVMQSPRYCYRSFQYASCNSSDCPSHAKTKLIKTWFAF